MSTVNPTFKDDAAFQKAADVALAAPVQVDNGPWCRTPNTSEYSAEASSWMADVHVPLCPHCKNAVIRWGEPEVDSEGEVTHWRITHTCGATLTIWND